MTEQQLIKKAMSALAKRSVEKRMGATAEGRSEYMKRVRFGKPLVDKSKVKAKKGSKINGK